MLAAFDAFPAMPVDSGGIADCNACGDSLRYSLLLNPSVALGHLHTRHAEVSSGPLKVSPEEGTPRTASGLQVPARFGRRSKDPMKAATQPVVCERAFSASYANS
jgi:hypothetical protein